MGQILAAPERFRRDAPLLQQQWDVPAVGFEGSFVGQKSFAGEGFAGAGYINVGGFEGARHDGIQHDYGVPHEAHEEYGVPHEEYGIPHEEYGPPALRVEPVTEQ